MVRTVSITRLTALILAFLLLFALVAVAELGQTSQTSISRIIQRSQQRQVLLTSVLHDLSAAEAAQRAYLLTGDRAELRLYEAAEERVSPQLAHFLDLYQRDTDFPQLAQDAPALAQLRAATQMEQRELSSSLALYSSAGSEQAMQLLRNLLAMPLMRQINDAAATLMGSERALVEAQLVYATRLRVISRALMGGVALLAVALLCGAAALLARQSRRRRDLTEQLARENEELERRVQRRTAELSALSTHLQHLAETEKASLARELHDELGGLLIAVKMDASWLHKRWPEPPPEIQARWLRVLKVLDDGVDFKRRVVESLRPTLLDNMGLFPAARWITHEICGRAGLQYSEIYPEHEPPLTDDAAIMVFRLIQESMTNIAKHAHATHARLQIDQDEQQLTVLIEDNGIGIDAERREAIGSHGLAIMRHRVRSCGGTLEVGPGSAGGTRILARMPLNAITRTPVATEAPERPAVALEASLAHTQA